MTDQSQKRRARALLIKWGAWWLILVTGATIAGGLIGEQKLGGVRGFSYGAFAADLALGVIVVAVYLYVWRKSRD